MFLPIALPNRIGVSVGASFGWIANLEDNEFKNLKNERITGSTVFNATKGFNLGLIAVIHYFVLVMDKLYLSIK